MFTDDPLTAQTTVIKTVHVTQLRLRIDALRVRYGLGTFAWTDPSLIAGTTPVRAVHITDLRTALNEAYSAALLTPPAYTDPSLAGVQVKVAHIVQLRSLVIAIE